VGTESVTLAEYVRTIESYVCQKNDGHLIRVVGPAFEIVSRWERDGVPLKVALRGIDRYFERYYRSGPKRRPVRVEFCDTDVLEVFDEWRRAVGVTARAGVRESSPDFGESAGAPGPLADSLDTADATDSSGSRGPSLPGHLQRALLKLSSARVAGTLGPELDDVIDRVSDELDRARASARGLRGEVRRALLDRLAALDRELLAAAAQSDSAADLDALGREAADELAAFRDRLSGDAFAAAVSRSRDRLLRERLALPVLTFD
jgi:hypothetical protein